MEVETNVHLHAIRFSRRTLLNRLFAAAYTCGIFALFFRHALAVLHCSSFASFFVSISLWISDVVLAFMWCTTQSFRMRPVARRWQFPENLDKVIDRNRFPALDIFICTADPYKEPPTSVVNTALSVMAYDYPMGKISVYVSDDGGSQLTLFAFMEAAKFGRHWLPFCRKCNLVERCPEAYFSSNYPTCADSNTIKMMYERMKKRIEGVVERGVVNEEYINNSEGEKEAFGKWTQEFTRQQHPTVIQVLLENGKDADISGHAMPNLIYVSREKSKSSPHHFKAGALNALLRVSAIMTNAPMVLTLDCDMYSNDPETPQRVLCYFSDQSLAPNLGYVQFPQRYHGLNKADIYASVHKRLYQLNTIGMDGLFGPCYLGTGCFFTRRVFFGPPASFLAPERPELCPEFSVNGHISSPENLSLAHLVAGSDYEDQSNWGYEMGFRYGSLSEDFHTGYKMQCEGWKSIFCHPERAAFLGDIPITLNDVLTQNRRWCVGQLQVGSTSTSPMTFGLRKMGPLMSLSYTHYVFWAIWSIPVTIYAFVPQIALLNGIPIFPRISETWFLLYVFLFLGAYCQECLDFLIARSSFQRWWSDQRMWLLRGLTSYLFALVEHSSKSLGIAAHGFNVTSKVVDDQQVQRYDQGIFDFGVPSPMLVPLTMAAIINLLTFLFGLLLAFKARTSLEEYFIQLFIAGFAVVNCLPIYEAIFIRSDRGRMPARITIVSSFLAWMLYLAVYIALKR